MGGAAGRRPDWLVDRPIAHRGLHDGNVAVFENSLSAFAAAVEHGYAIECDVHMAADGVPVVFHDDTLERLTARSGPVGALPAAELASLHLGGTNDRIPTLAAVLALVDGRVPLVVELKGTTPEADADFIEHLEPVVSGYAGEMALMSFDPRLVEDAGRLADRFPIGLTAEGTREDTLERHRAVFTGKCSFVSYNVHHLPNAFTDWVRRERRLPVICWTLRTAAAAARSRLHADQITFEGFLPPV